MCQLRFKAPRKGSLFKLFLSYLILPFYLKQVKIGSFIILIWTYIHATSWIHIRSFMDLGCKYDEYNWVETQIEIFIVYPVLFNPFLVVQFFAWIRHTYLLHVRTDKKLSKTGQSHVMKFLYSSYQKLNSCVIQKE